MPPMEYQSRLVILLVITFIFFLSPNGTPPSSHVRDTIAKEAYKLDLLRNSTYGDPLNVTALGLLPANGTSTPPKQVREKWRALKELVKERRAYNALWRNATGNVLGRWKRLDMSDVETVNANWTGWDRNLTEGVREGLVTAMIDDTTLVELDGKNEWSEVGEVNVHVSIKDADGGSQFSMTMNGVHWPKSGEMVVTTTSERFGGLFALPHFTTSELAYNQSKALMLESLGKIIELQERTLSTDAPWRTATDDPSLHLTPKCEYIAYLQLHPIDPVEIYLDVPSSSNQQLLARLTSQTMRAIEHELRFPTGISLPPPPHVVASAMIYSPTCGFVLETDAMKGEKTELIHWRTSNLGLGAALVTAVQTLLLIRQMNESNTPSTVSRVSFWTIVMLAVVDGYFFFTFMILAIYLDACYLALATASFAHLVLLSMYEMRFLVSAYRVQRPERQPPAQPAPAASAAEPLVPAGELPAPVTSATPTPIIHPLPPPPDPANPNQTPTPDTEDDIRSEISTLHTRFYFALVFTLFLTLNATSWPPFYRDLFLHTLLLITNSFWVPQIYRNVYRGTRKPFTHEFIFGTSLCRLGGVFYIYLYPKNIFHIEPHPTAVAVIVGWVWMQCVVLIIHELFGPRWMIPHGWVPDAYDYHGPLPTAAVDEEGAGEDVGVSEGTGSGRGVWDCAICMQTVEVGGSGEGGDGGVRRGNGGGEGVGLLGRRQYMVTPCRHVFHSACLEGWMRYRLQCPICRNSLPAL